MSSETRISANKTHAGPRVVIFYFDSRRVATIPPKTYEEAESFARQMFRIPEQQAVTIQAMFYEELAEIDPRLFPSVCHSINKYWILVPTEDDGCTGPDVPSGSSISPLSRSGSRSPLPRPPTERISIYFKSQRRDSRAIAFSLSPTLPFSSIFQSLASQVRDPPLMQYRLLRHGQTIDSEATPRSLGVKKGETIIFQQDGKARKPVIYLFSPSNLDASVQLSLTREWRFSTLYPTAPTKIIGNTEQVEWQVSVRPDGSMQDKRSGAKVAYLFWEAAVITNSLDTPPSSRPASPISTHAIPFSPCNASLSPCDSVLLPIESVPTYLDQSLLALGLHTEARTSFITYWLPDMQKYRHIALRFLNQESYSAAAPLEITPTPDVVGRVFMLFRGVGEAELVSWENSTPKSADGWNDVVGIPNVENLNNGLLFRVVEWGGMEVYC